VSATTSLVRHAIRDGARVRGLLDVDAIARAAELMRDAVLAGKKVLLCGNGGSAADAQHIAAELVGRFVVERRPLPAIALTVDTSALTAIANDYGFEHVFARQVGALGAPGDVLVAITTSGRSESVRRAVAAAQALGMSVIGMTGAKGAEFAALCDIALVSPSASTPNIQEAHIAMGHAFCLLVERALFPAAPRSAAKKARSGKAPAKRSAPARRKPR